MIAMSRSASHIHSIAFAKNNLPALVHDAEAGKCIELTRRGKPVAVLVSLAEYDRLRARKVDLAAALAAWRAELAESGSDALTNDVVEAVFSNTRDQTPGRDVKW